jgi:hypothetical protein
VASELAAAIKASGGAASDGGASKRVTLLTQNGALLQPTRSYDQRRVCAFCAQFFDFDEVYRPSFGAKLAKLQDEAKAKEVAEDNKFWDPLMNAFVPLDTTSKKARQRKQDRQARRDAEGGSLRGGKDGGSSGNTRSGANSSGNSTASTTSTMFLAVDSKRRGAGGAAVHGHSGGVVPGAGSKSLGDKEKDREVAAFRAEAGTSAFWHAAATDVLATKGLDSFRKTNRDRNLAKPTVV